MKRTEAVTVVDQPRLRLLVGACLCLLWGLAGCGERAIEPLVIDETPLTSQKPSAGTLYATDGQAPVPVRVRIPAIGVDAPINPLQVDERGVLLPPEKNDAAGWWKDGPEPGERGPAVVAGHVDSDRGPAVFFQLSDLPTGAQVLIDRADRTTVMFTTYRLERHSKNAFPTRAVYGSTPNSELRLITCGGKFDDTDNRYLANVIVFARRTS